MSDVHVAYMKMKMKLHTNFVELINLLENIFTNLAIRKILIMSQISVKYHISSRI